jgi:hypothetical protein
MFKRIRAWFGAPASASESSRPAAESPPPPRTGGSLIQHSGPSPGPEQAELSPHANEAHLRALEAVLLEQQTILLQQIERFGDYAPPYMILQLDETQQRLAEIQARLAQA